MPGSPLGENTSVFVRRILGLSVQPQGIRADLDSDGDGSLSKAEIGSFADKVSEMAGQSVNVDEITF